MSWRKWLGCWAREAPIHGVMAHMGFSQRTACSQAGGPRMQRQVQDTRAEGWPCPPLGLDQEPLSIRKEGRLWEARGAAACPLWEAHERQGWQQGVHRGR